MKLYIVTCDLLQPGDYASLRTRVEAMKGCQLLESQWALLANESAAELKELFRRIVDRNDRIVVVEADKDWASRHAFAKLGDLFEPSGDPAKVLWRREWNL
jgi:hypothetical protein